MEYTKSHLSSSAFDRLKMYRHLTLLSTYGSSTLRIPLCRYDVAWNLTFYSLLG